NTEAMSVVEASSQIAHFQELQPLSALTTLIEIEGKGLLYHCFLHTRASMLEGSSFIITIDDSIVFDVEPGRTASRDDKANGIIYANFIKQVSDSHIIPYPISQRLGLTNSKEVSLPYINGDKMPAYSDVFYSTKPIRFNNLKVQCKGEEFNEDYSTLCVAYRLEG